MIRWTTPDFIVNVDDDLTGMDVYVSIKQLKTQIDLTGDDLLIAVDEGGSTIAFRLTQQQSGSLSIGSAKCQVNVVDPNGRRNATYEFAINVSENLINRVLEYKG